MFQVRDFEAGFLIRQPPPTLLNAFANWDGVWYASIARNGYEDPENQGSFFVFFPFFPLLGRLVERMTGLGEIWSLLIVSHALAIFARRNRLIVAKEFCDLVGAAIIVVAIGKCECA